MANACSKAEQAFCKGFLLNNTPSEPAVSTVKSDIALKKKKTKIKAFYIQLKQLLEC